MGHFEVHTQEGSVLHLCTKFETDRSSYSKVIRGSQNFEIRHVTQATPTYIVHTQVSVLYVCTKFEADSSIRSKVIMGSQNFEIGSRDPRPRPFSTLIVKFV